MREIGFLLEEIRRGGFGAQRNQIARRKDFVVTLKLATKLKVLRRDGGKKGKRGDAYR